MGVDHSRRAAADQPSGGQPPSQPIVIQQGGDNHRADEGNPMSGGPFNDGDGPAGGGRPLLAGSGRAANLAWRYIGFGDTQFSAGEFLEANTRYRKAVAAAPEVADPHFRQGYALMAAGRWRLAADAIRRGLKLDPDWPRSGFSNAELYAGHQQMKTEHLEKLAEAAEAEQQDVDRLFLLGVMLHFDGRPDRARPFFERAQQLTGGNDPAVAAFLAEG
jgi:tetratricopeptide (TPR) repeat protein